ncbi:Serine protease [Phytophthora megakarya]|nr:Serine protease [Phytophthora megakarya]
MALYFTSAMTSSALSALVSKLRGNGRVFSIGASGAVSAVFTVSCLLFPDQRLLLYGIFDMTSAQMLQLYTALNIVGAGFQRNLRVDCVGHLGGQGAGFAFHQAPSTRN